VWNISSRAPYRVPPDSPRRRNRLCDFSSRTRTRSHRGRDRKILARTAYSSRRKRRRNHGSFGRVPKVSLADKLLTEGEPRTRGPNLLGRIAPNPSGVARVKGPYAAVDLGIFRDNASTVGAGSASDHPLERYLSPSLGILPLGVKLCSLLFKSVEKPTQKPSSATDRSKYTTNIWGSLKHKTA
jgi:hypothetical protein